jgi:hypothetical protein
MSYFGCPEQQSKGWSVGLISLNFKLEETRYNTTILRHIKEATEDNEYKYDWPEVDKNVFQPITSNSMTLQFCFKSRNNTTLDVGSFPEGNYSVFADESGCKEGNIIKRSLQVQTSSSI